MIAAIAARQHGVVSRTQLLAAGVTRRQVQWRVKQRRLHVVHRGVYAVGHRALSQEAVWMAAVLAAGEDAALSHWSSASLLRMRPGRGPLAHVTSPRARRSAGRIRFHQSVLPPDETTVVDGIPTTTPARTQLDLAPLLPSPALARMVATTPPQPGPSLADLLDRYPRKAGRGKLEAIVARPVAFTRSDLEAAWLDAFDRARIPAPDTNTIIEGYECDFVWKEHRTIAELDTYLTHGDQHAFETDRRRDRKLAAAGWRVVRLTDEPSAEALDDLSRVLAASAARSPSRSAAA